MLRYILYLCFGLPLISAAQDVSRHYINQKIEEARDLYWKSNYDAAINLLTDLKVLSQKHNVPYGEALAQIKKIYYESDVKNTSAEPGWSRLEALIARDKSNNHYLEMELLNLKGYYFKARKDNLPRSIQYLEEGIRLGGNPPKNSTILGELYYNLAQANETKGDRVAAASFFWKAVNVFEALQRNHALEPVYGDLANCYFLMGEKEKAIALALKAIGLSKANNNYENLGIHLSNLGRMYQLGGNADSALQYFEESFRYTTKSTRKENRFVSLSDAAFLYHSKKDRANALKYMQEAIALGREMNRPNLHRYIRTAAMFAGYTGNEELMNKYYDESYKLAHAVNDKDALRDWHGSMAYYFASVKKDSARAYPHLISFHAYKDSLLNEKSKKDFHELEVLYETEKKQAQIDKMATEQKIQKLELEKKNALLRGNLIEAAQKEKEIQLLTQEKLISNLKIEQQAKSLGLSGAQVKNLQQQKKIAVQESLLKEEKIQNERLKRNLVIAILLAAVILFAFLLNRILLKKKLEQKNLLLKERSRIAAELHDEVGSTLTAINLLSHATIHRLSEPEPKKQVQKIQENTQLVMENISDIIWSMNPDNDSFGQITIRMKEFAANVLEPQNISYHFNISIPEHIKLSTEKRRDLYLIFKEAVNNLAKYSKADKAAIEIGKQNKHIMLNVKDNGIGFAQPTSQKGNGLRNMRARAEKHGGSFSLESNRQGSAIRIKLPYA